MPYFFWQMHWATAPISHYSARIVSYNELHMSLECKLVWFKLGALYRMGFECSRVDQQQFCWHEGEHWEGLLRLFGAATGELMSEKNRGEGAWTSKKGGYFCRVTKMFSNQGGRRGPHHHEVWVPQLFIWGSHKSPTDHVSDLRLDFSLLKGLKQFPINIADGNDLHSWRFTVVH